MKKILFVAMQNSPHTIRWILQAKSEEWEVHLFPISQYPLHPDLPSWVKVHHPWKIARASFVSGFLTSPIVTANILLAYLSSLFNFRQRIPILSSLMLFLVDSFRSSLGVSGNTSPIAYGPFVLSQLIKNLKPDLIQSLEFQHAGYCVYAARGLMDAKLFPKWMGTVWGSDILYYRSIPNHLIQIKQLLSSLDIFSCECKRDIDFARELGFTGVFSPVMPDAGSVDISNLKQWRDLIVPSKRRIILLRGYQSFSGRALTALDALEICQERLHGYRILVYSASNEVKQRVKELSLSTSIDIHILTHITPYAMLRLFARARLFIGISISDGISRSMIEAMAMGAFPIQTDTSCCEEWIIDGVNGYSVPVDDIEVISEKIQSALANNAMVDNASRMNLAIIDERLNNETLTRHALEFYRASLGLC